MSLFFQATVTIDHIHIKERIDIETNNSSDDEYQHKHIKLIFRSNHTGVTSYNHSLGGSLRYTASPMAKILFPFKYSLFLSFCCVINPSKIDPFVVMSSMSCPGWAMLVYEASQQCSGRPSAVTSS